MTSVTSEITLNQNGELAIVRVLDGGRVEVERDGGVTSFRPHYTFETVVDEFKSRGWEEKQDHGYTEEMQTAIDEYIELHEQASEIKAKMEKLKKTIRPHVEENGPVYGTKGKCIYLQPAKASNATSRYTDYELRDIMNRLEGDMLRKVTEVRINADKLEALLGIEKLPQSKIDEIRGRKIVLPGTPRFSVKK